MKSVHGFTSYILQTFYPIFIIFDLLVFQSNTRGVLGKKGVLFNVFIRMNVANNITNSTWLVRICIYALAWRI